MPTPWAPPLMPLPANISLARATAQKHKEKGNYFYQLQHFELAISEYMNALVADPSYVDAYYNLGKTFIILGDDGRASEAFQRLLMVKPEDHDARASLADMYVRLGKQNEAIAQYQTILNQNPNFDPARRNMAWIQFQQAFARDPNTARETFLTQAKQTLTKAKDLVKLHYQDQNRPDLIPLLDEIGYEFAKTQMVNRSSNLAEYEYRETEPSILRFKPELAFSFPEVLAAYMAHELVHAADKDGISSIMEEQDGYQSLAKFWLEHRNGIQEPNLDLAADLYQRSPDRLSAKVRELYSARDPLLPDKSPGHGLPLNAFDAAAYNREKAENLEKFVYERVKVLMP